jgi:hypothetical protein
MLYSSQVEVKAWRDQIPLHQANRELKCRHADGRNRTEDLSLLDLESYFFEVAPVNSDRDCVWAKVGLGLS